eukprot:TRINITY_DN62437_c0_g1_i1.p1 TRINITY_DN62437_c0_g1~~TRINITY_DN62437_c0_g1_i1.p1  ORF type:complete len:309 (-),score=53.88 TRINITY_DN62437_c0_g1_i1:622-1548(-)
MYAGVSIAFQKAGIPVMTLPQAAGQATGTQKVRVVMTNAGESRFVDNTLTAVNEGVGREELASLLCDLDYITTADDPLMPALAKAFYVNQLGDFTVWPGVFGMAEAQVLLALHSKDPYRLQRNPGNLAFVLPIRDTSSKKLLKQYGTKICAAIVQGGGAFLLSSAPEMVDSCLRRLGFLDDHLNTDFGEAVDVFKASSRNHKNLASMSLSIPDALDDYSKRAMLHTALMNSCSKGHWSTSPGDGFIRRHLASSKYIRSEAVASEELLDAMRTLALRQGLPSRNTYNGYVQALTTHLTADYASRRRHIE